MQLIKLCSHPSQPCYFVTNTFTVTYCTLRTTTKFDAVILPKNVQVFLPDSDSHAEVCLKFSYLTGVGKLAGENDDIGVLPVRVCIILLPDSGVVCSLLIDF